MVQVKLKYKQHTNVDFLKQFYLLYRCVRLCLKLSKESFEFWDTMHREKFSYMVKTQETRRLLTTHHSHTEIHMCTRVSECLLNISLRLSYPNLWITYCWCCMVHRSYYICTGFCMAWFTFLVHVTQCMINSISHETHN